MVRSRTTERTSGGVQRGAPPLAGGLEDVPPYTTLLYFPPFLEGRGPGGWSAPLSRPKPRTARAQRRVAAWPSTTVAVVVPPVHEAGSPEGSTPTGRRSGGCASIHYTSSLSPLPSRKGARGMVRSRTTERTSGESRGEHPHWQAVWRMCLHTLLFFHFPPFLPGRGPGGWCGPALRCVQAGSPEGSTPTGRRSGGCASIHYTSSLSPLPPGGWCGPALRCVQAGSPEGSTPTGRRNGGGLHTLHFFTIPLPGRKGEGDGAVPHYGAYKRGVQSGAPPLAGGMEDVPPYTTLLHFPPFLEGRGPGGMVRSRTTVRTSGESRGEHPHWQAVWRMCLHTLHFFTFPPSWKEGGQGDGPLPYRGQSPEPRESSSVWRRGPALRWRRWCPQCMKRGVQRGAPPLAGYMGYQDAMRVE